ncbi:hypothetical protein CW304_06870 [Bacillus sp. UFRGS-B20]|nr:hypothetical protein CW304_06870 [Bacillus sp. UFRGS-B20]
MLLRHLFILHWFDSVFCVSKLRQRCEHFGSSSVIVKRLRICLESSCCNNLNCYPKYITT